MVWGLPRASKGWLALESTISIIGPKFSPKRWGLHLAHSLSRSYAHAHPINMCKGICLHRVWMDEAQEIIVVHASTYMMHHDVRQ